VVVDSDIITGIIDTGIILALSLSLSLDIQRARITPYIHICMCVCVCIPCYTHIVVVIGSLEEQNQQSICNYKRDFIKLAYTSGGWVVQEWLSAHWRAREPGSYSVQEVGSL
jgi:hypothetical protein